MRRFILFAICCTCLFVATNQSYANVFAAHVDASDPLDISSSGTVTISYRLNEEADQGVMVKVIGPLENMPQVIRTLDATEVDSAQRPGAAKGANSVVWDGKTDSGADAYNGSYTFQVIAGDSGYSSWTDITPLQVANPTEPIEALQPYNVGGLVAIKDQNDPNFGKVLFNHTYDGTSINPGDDAEQPNQSGVYILNNDYTYFGDSRSTAFATGNASATYGTSTYSPWKIFAGEDGKLYQTDFNDSHESVWAGDTSWSTVTELLRQSDAVGVGGTENHGNNTGGAVVGTGASKVYYAIDEDLKLPGAADAFNVYRWDIGNTAAGYTAMPSLIIAGDDGALLSPGMVNNPDMLALPDGDLVVVGYRWANTELALFRWDVDTGAPVWQKTGTDIHGGALTSAEFADAVYDENTDRIYVINRYGDLFAIDPDDGSTIDIGSPDLSTGSGCRGFDIDAAGNFIVADYAVEHTYIWSPPSEANSFTTTAPINITVSGGEDKPESSQAEGWENYQ